MVSDARFAMLSGLLILTDAWKLDFFFLKKNKYDFLSRDLAAIIHFSDKNKTIVYKFRLYFFFVF